MSDAGLMPAISIRQPWAWAILHLPHPEAKDCENRSWPIPGKYFGRPVLIHAGKQFDHVGAWDTIEMTSGHRPPPKSALIRGALLGAVIFTDCVTEHGSEWFYGRYGWIIGPRTAFSLPADCKGRLGFWTPPEQLHLTTADYCAAHELVEPPLAPVVDLGS